MKATRTNRHLVVDDEKDVRRVLRAFIESRHASIAVDEAASGEEALGLVDSAGLDGYDVVWTDFKMDGMTGLQCADALRKKGFQKYIVMFSGNPAPDVDAGQKAAIIDTFLRKPVRKRTIHDLPILQLFDDTK